MLVVAVGAGLAGGARRTSATWRNAARSRSRLVIGNRQAFAPGSTAKAHGCQPTAATSGYVNPLAQATLISERIDMGVDYAGTGRLLALGAGRITYVGTSGTGWPGAFVEYRLLNGPDAGCFVYYAEGVRPASWLHVGETVHAGQGIAYVIPGWDTGMEIGWGAGRSTRTYAQLSGTWTPSEDAEDVATRAGRSFSALIADLGGPPGKVEH